MGGSSVEIKDGAPFGGLKLVEIVFAHAVHRIPNIFHGHGGVSCQRLGQNVVPLVRLLGSDTVLGSLRQIEICHHRRFRDRHLVVDILHHNALSCGICQSEVDHHAHGGVEVILPEQVQGLVHAGRLVQQQPDSGGGSQVGLVGVLIDGGVIPDHVDRNRQPLFIHAIQRSVQRGQDPNVVLFQHLIQTASRLTDKAQIDRGDGGISLAGLRGDHQRAAGLPVEVSAEQLVTVRAAHSQGAAPEGTAVDRHIGQQS